jgi:hypothetical protein
MRIITYLDQSQVIIAPFESESNRLGIRSRVAQMHSKDDFISIDNEIKAIAKVNSLMLPSLSIY